MGSAKVRAGKIVAGQTMVSIAYPSMKQTLADLFIDAAISLPASLQSIPLQAEARAGTFVSAVALQLASQQSAAEVAQALLAAVPVTQGLKLWVKAPAWIYGQFSADAIATHLQQLTAFPPRLPLPSPAALDASFSDPLLFPVQYAHARCCSLLCLAQREGLIDLRAGEQRFPTISTPISWCTAQDQLRLQHPAEQTLIRSLLDFPGALQTPKQVWRSDQWPGVPLPWPLVHQRLVRYTQQWGEDFLHFYRDCRIFGEVSQQNRALSQARLGLIATTQRVLAFLLQDLLHLMAPEEL
ncbi:Arginine--tRNA ligase [Acaryochloris thomasi RCC1774]|uniref:arginine--tRNA ligase n=1 Tax=Acaryochloris thomasi RCC1774 TaxID=1764569 RepID=A0A2W1JSY0_9CYAN|nr:DALR anticodon-binding domain-containing protein [Acaryochloris thomasi]PZD74245.1 Arginine--tRNA ligase [Acaryochloris thomasi RCC1774]